MAGLVVRHGRAVQQFHAPALHGKVPQVQVDAGAIAHGAGMKAPWPCQAVQRLLREPYRCQGLQQFLLPLAGQRQVGGRIDLLYQGLEAVVGQAFAPLRTLLFGGLRGVPQGDAALGRQLHRVALGIDQGQVLGNAQAERLAGRGLHPPDQALCHHAQQRVFQEEAAPGGQRPVPAQHQAGLQARRLLLQHGLDALGQRLEPRGGRLPLRAQALVVQGRQAAHQLAGRRAQAQRQVALQQHVIGLRAHLQLHAPAQVEVRGQLVAEVGQRHAAPRGGLGQHGLRGGQHAGLEGLAGGQGLHAGQGIDRVEPAQLLQRDHGALLARLVPGQGGRGQHIDDAVVRRAGQQLEHPARFGRAIGSHPVLDQGQGQPRTVLRAGLGQQLAGQRRQLLRAGGRQVQQRARGLGRQGREQVQQRRLVQRGNGGRQALQAGGLGFKRCQGAGIAARWHGLAAR